MKNAEMNFIHYLLCKEMRSDIYTDNSGSYLLNDINPKDFIKEVWKNGCINLVYRYKEELPETISERIEEAYKDYREKNERLYQVMLEVIQCAREKNIKFIEPKGISLTKVIYGDYYERQYNDLDFLVDAKDIIAFGKMLIQQGFIHRHDGKIEDICEKMRKNGSEYFFETKFFRWYKQDRMLSVELKMATSAIDIDQIRSFMENVQEIDLGDERVTTFDQEHLFLHLCANVYRNFASYESVMRSNLKLRDFYDIYQFEQRGEIDWERCRDLARRYNLYGELKYIQEEFWELFHISVLDNMRLKEQKYEGLYFWKRDTVLQKEEPEVLKERIHRRYKNLCLKPGNRIDVSYSKIQLQAQKDQDDINITMHFKKLDMEYIEERRWYFYFVELLDLESAEEDTRTGTVLLYWTGIEFRYRVDFYDMHKVNLQSTANIDLVGKRVNLVECGDDVELKFQINLQDIGIEKWHLFNILFDISILDDYYKHGKYLRKPDEILELVQQ